MRKSLAVAVLLGAAAVTFGQPGQPPPVRYGVQAQPKRFPQASPKDALRSAVQLIEQNRFDYLAAHLLDPQFVKVRVDERARQIEKQVEADLIEQRAEQRRYPAGIPNEARLPVDPRQFADIVREEARQRAFRLVVRDLRDTLTENPDHLKDLRRFLREGTFVDAGDTATATLPGVKDRQVFFRRAEAGWVVEDRQTPEPEKK